MKRVGVYLFILLVLLNNQTVFGKPLSADINKDVERELIDKLDLRNMPNNSSNYVLVRVNMETLISNEHIAGSNAKSSSNGVNNLPSNRIELENNAVQPINDLVVDKALTLSLVDNQRVTLVFEALESSDPSGVIHWLGRVQGDPDSFVRLSIDRASNSKRAPDDPSASQIAGIITTQGKTTKLRPTGVSDYHILYEVNDGNDNYLLKLNSESQNETKARWLEAKGIQFDLLSEMPESSFTIGNRGYLTGLRNDLSHGEIGKLEVKSYLDLGRAVEVLAPYYGLTGSEKFTFEKHFSRGNNDFYDLSQSINGLPVLRSGLRVVVSRTNHKIFKVFGKIVVDNGFARVPLISEGDAKTLALDYMVGTDEGGHIRFEAFEADEPQLVYIFAKSWEPDQLRLNWAIKILRNGSPVQLFVDTDTGEVRSLDIIENLPPRAQVCDAFGSVGVPPQPDFPDPYHCSTSGVKLIFDPNGVCVGGSGPGLPMSCDNPRYTVARDTFIAGGVMWGDLLQDTDCCAMGEGNKYDILVNIPSQHMQHMEDDAIGQHYAGILMEGSYIRNVTMIRMSELWNPAVPDPLFHEIGHALHAHLSPLSYSTGGGTAIVEAENKAVKEGIAHVFGIIQKNYYHTPQFNDPNWELETGEWGSVAGYDLSYPTDYDDFDPNGSEHVNALILAHAFYKLVTGNNGVNFRQASILFGRAIEFLEDEDNNNGLSFDEVRAAMETAASSNQSHLGAIQNAWSDVGIGACSSNGCSSSCTLQTPSDVSALWTGCNGNGWTSYNIIWGDACRSATSYYQIWTSQPIGAPYTLKHSLSFSESEQRLVRWIITGASSAAKIKACNSQKCSPLSTDSATMTLKQMCNNGNGNYD